MTTSRVRLMRNIRENVSPTLWAMMNDAPLPEPYNRWDEFNGPSRELWLQHRDDILADWIQAHPGSRPSLWWQHDAPRLPEDQHGDYANWYFAKDLIIPRARLGGVGTPVHEALRYVPRYHLGLPTSWVDRFDVLYYNGFAVDEEGTRMGTEFHAGDLLAEAVDPDDLPTYESQATYLKRLGLLMPGELRRIPKAAFLPEQITYEEKDNDE